MRTQLNIGMGMVLVSASLACLLSACTSSGPSRHAIRSAGTDAAVQAGINVQPGSEEDFMVNVGRRTFFTEGSATLDDTARVTLDKQAQWLLQYPHWQVKLQGFADDPGSATEQRALSQKRAEAVREYLVAKGIGAERLKAKGYGRDRLVSDCAGIECKSQNRRVVTNPLEEPDL
jgi:peptidoglycan-associated lipoprotein